VEIVEYGQRAFLCRSTGELVAYSARLASDQQLLDEIGRRAADRSCMFNQSMFSQRIAQVIGGYMTGFGGPMDERTLRSDGLR
jgi:hypothetical protein